METKPIVQRVTHTYLLTDAAKSITWSEWKRLGGCGLSDYATACAARQVGAFQGRHASPVTLGQLQVACVVAGREIARFAKDHLAKPEWAQVEYSFNQPGGNGTKVFITRN